MFGKTIIRYVFATAVATAAVSAKADVFNMPAGQTSLQFVTVGDPGNVGEQSRILSGDRTYYGSVPYVYQMGKYDVTNAQYDQFLTAKATTSDPYGLWNSQMSSDAEGGIIRSASAPYTYTVKTGQGNQPVVDVTWFDTLRFANWLGNGQGAGDTETGSYTLLGGTPTPSNASSIFRNPGAQFVLPSENEWYKAAYYDPTLNSGSGGYWRFPTKSNMFPTSQAPPGGSNSANFFDSTNGYALTGSMTWDSSYDYLTEVGAYTGSSSPYGTFDQGGDVSQWIEAQTSSWPGICGGGWSSIAGELTSSSRHYFNPTYENLVVGFRVALVVPEPSSLILLAIAALSASAYLFRRSR